MKKLSFVWPHNRLFKHDGDEFSHQAMAYSMRDDYVIRREIPKTGKTKRRNEIFRQMYGRQDIDRVSFFCHGQPKSFGAGFNLSNINELGEAIKQIASPNCVINLFCCKTGKSPEGLAAKLSDYSGLPVLAHSTSGHTTRNPNKWLFYKGDAKPLFQGKKPSLNFMNWQKNRSIGQYFTWLENTIQMELERW